MPIDKEKESFFSKITSIFKDKTKIEIELNDIQYNHLSLYYYKGLTSKKSIVKHVLSDINEELFSIEDIENRSKCNYYFYISSNDFIKIPYNIFYSDLDLTPENKKYEWHSENIERIVKRDPEITNHMIQDELVSIDRKTLDIYESVIVSYELAKTGGEYKEPINGYNITIPVNTKDKQEHRYVNCGHKHITGNGDLFVTVGVKERIYTKDELSIYETIIITPDFAKKGGIYSNPVNFHDITISPLIKDGERLKYEDFGNLKGSVVGDLFIDIRINPISDKDGNIYVDKITKIIQSHLNETKDWLESFEDNEEAKYILEDLNKNYDELSTNIVKFIYFVQSIIVDINNKIGLDKGKKLLLLVYHLGLENLDNKSLSSLAVAITDPYFKIHDKEWAKEIFKILEFRIVSYNDLRSFASNISSYHEDQDWAKKVYKKAYKKANTSLEYAYLASDLMEVKDTTLAKKFSKDAFHKAVTFEDYYKLAIIVFYELKDTKWSIEISEYAHEKANTYREYLDLGNHISDSINDKVWAKKVFIRAYEKAKSIREIVYSAYIMFELGDSKYAEEIFKVAFKESKTAIDFSIVAENIAMHLEEKEWSMDIYKIAIENTENILEFYEIINSLENSRFIDPGDSDYLCADILKRSLSNTRYSPHLYEMISSLESYGLIDILKNKSWADDIYRLTKSIQNK